MKLIHRNIDFEKDRDYILERHCRINYACESPWKREMSYPDYRSEWFSLTSQESGFRFAEIQEIYVEEEYRRHGVATQLYEYAEAKARRNDAKVIRSGTGLCNKVSIQLHE